MKNESHAPGKNVLLICDEEQNCEDQGKKRNRAASQSDECQNLLVFRADISRHLWRKYRDTENVVFILYMFISKTSDAALLIKPPMDIM